MIYLDNAATTMTYQEVVKEMSQYFTELYGNPSSIYEFAGKSKSAMEEARVTIANTLGASPKEIYFTSGGTESDNWALRSITKTLKKKGNHIITSKIEHPAIMNTCKHLEETGYRVTYINVDENGIIKLRELEQAIEPDTILISIMAANNEIGTLQPIRLIGELAKKRGILFHTDAVQMYGQLPIQVNRDNIDMLSASAHKFHGPKGVGFLYVRESVPIAPFILGGSQENHMRAGTQNVPSIVGMALAAKMTHETMQNRMISTAKKRDYLIRRILREVPFSRLNGDWKRRLPGNANISFQFVNASELLALLDMKGICVSAGSACSSHSKKPSAVLTALGLPEEIVQGAIRMTLSDETTMKELDYVTNTLKELVADCRKNNDEYLAF